MEKITSQIKDFLQYIALQFISDPKLAELHTTIKAQLGHYTPDALRHSKADRSAAATKAQAIFSQAQAWMNPAQAA